VPAELAQSTNELPQTSPNRKAVRHPYAGLVLAR
jgi:hypothetical protein